MGSWLWWAVWPAGRDAGGVVCLAAPPREQGNAGCGVQEASGLEDVDDDDRREEEDTDERSS
jgi:hypothetical protein